MFWLAGVLVNREVVALYPRSRSEASSPDSSQLVQQAFVGFTVLLLSSLRGVHIRIVRRGVPLAFPDLHIAPFPCGSKLRNPGDSQTTRRTWEYLSHPLKL